MAHQQRIFMILFKRLIKIGRFYRKEILRIYILWWYLDITVSKKSSPSGWYF